VRTKRNILVSGGAGFIGSHLVDALLREGNWRVVVIDNFDDYYPRAAKEANLAAAKTSADFTLVEGDITNDSDLARLPRDFDAVVHLAAKAGVRPSIAQPAVYELVNIRGTLNLLEFARATRVPQFVFASSSSVYGENPNVPWREDENVFQPISPYAATKLAAEMIGHVYSHLHGLRFVGLRFFTVYGPRQRPDLAICKFARLLCEGRPIPLFGDGSTVRDYTFVGDVVRGIRAAVDFTESKYEVINVGNHQQVKLLEMVRALETAFGMVATIDWQPMQPGDVMQTFASPIKAQRLLGFSPSTPLVDGMQAFAAWFRVTNVTPPPSNI
jgi:UDP-glucuronate 4-epimerase